MVKIFISYRRRNAAFTLLLANKLSEQLDADIFIDFESIDQSDFDQSIMSHLRASDVFLLMVTEYTFTDRIHNDADWVRNEIKTALEMKIPIVLVSENGLYPPRDLPDDIREIVNKQGIEFYPAYFDAAVTRLVKFLTEVTRVQLKSIQSELLTHEQVLPVPEERIKEIVVEQSIVNDSNAQGILKIALSAYDANDYAQALFLFEALKEIGYQIPNKDIDVIIAKLRLEYMREERERHEAFEENISKLNTGLQIAGLVLAVIAIIGFLISTIFVASEVFVLLQNNQTAQTETAIAVLIAQLSTLTPTTTPTALDTPTVTVTSTASPTVTVTNTLVPIVPTNTLVPPTVTNTPVPTLSTEQYGTAIANFATQQTSPTPVPTITSTVEGKIAGNGDISPYYNTSLSYPNSMQVRLELIIREKALEETPLPDIVVSTINENFPTPDVVEVDVQQTPPPARANDREDNIPFLVIVELDCLETSFTGCERQEFTRLELVGVNSWNWEIQPVEDISGIQNLTMYLYEADEDGNLVSNNPFWEHPITIEVSDNRWLAIIEDNIGAFIGLIGAIIVALIGAGYFKFGNKEKAPKSLGVSAFISYKRKGSWGIAEKFHDKLTAKGVDAFIDSQDLHEGDFEKRLKQEIINRDYLVVILVKETLESEWVVKEIAYAFELGKTVIPVLIEGVKMEELNIPEEIAELKKQNAVTLYQSFFDAAIDKILVFLKPIK